MQQEKFAAEIDSVCDELVAWEPRSTSNLLTQLKKIGWVTRQVPIPVMSDWSRDAQHIVAEEISRVPDLVVFDFPHSAILAPDLIQCPSVMFTHNIEAEIFKRHWQVAKSPVHRWLWRNQYRKMLRYEKSVLERFDTSVAVSIRDCEFFQNEYQVEGCRSIPTGVDTEFFDHKLPNNDRQVVFCGSMDWLANIDGMQYFFDEVWPLIRKAVPDARMNVVGRNPPASLVSRVCSAAPEWKFSGFVEDVREHVQESAAFVIPLRVGGGTRIKAFEAMAMGSPVVSTSIGIEGLPVEHGSHFLRADNPKEMAGAVVSLLNDAGLRNRISKSARELVENKHGYRGVARVFENICEDTMVRIARKKRTDNVQESM